MFIPPIAMSDVVDPRSASVWRKGGVYVELDSKFELAGSIILRTRPTRTSPHPRSQPRSFSSVFS